MSQPSGWGFFFKVQFSLEDTASPPEPTRLTVPAEHGQLPTGWGTILKPPVTSLFEGTGLSVRFQYLSENIKQFESNTIWKALGGSHYLRICHWEEKSTLIFRRGWSHLGRLEWRPQQPWQSAAPSLWYSLSSSHFPFKETDENPTKVPNGAAPMHSAPRSLRKRLQTWRCACKRARRSYINLLPRWQSWEPDQ